MADHLGMPDDLKGSKKVDIGLKQPITKGAKKDIKFAAKAPDKDKSIAKDKEMDKDKDKEGNKKKWKKGKPGKKFMKVDGVVKGKSGRAGLEFPVARIHRYLKKYLPINGIVGAHSAVFVTAVLEYLVAEILEVCSNLPGKKFSRITPRHLMMGIKTDTELNTVVKATIAGGGTVPQVHTVLFEDAKTRFKQKYQQDAEEDDSASVPRRVPSSKKSKSSKGMPAGEY
eukprot:CAMPEP_0178437800 /NCGR_PEP_ID=MMETSP0689_2-20121128/35208_1 /TAXON_ID=160604 /ORGANISM="Amphidinium massartii, Strain CS-259" /LENGTH=226 /DNA_ID=CAMNT_0020060071 /DNA_START=86 /DNA_END=766 /DNA_ORIENTATION=+